MSRSHLFITGNITYSPRKITLQSGDISYFVKPYSIQSGYVHGDRVRARITKRGDAGRMAEVEVLSLVSRSRDPLLARLISKKGKQYIKVIPEQGNLEVVFLGKHTTEQEGEIISFRFGPGEQIEVLSRFGNEDDIDLDERLILWLSRARTEFPAQVIQEGQHIKQESARKSTGKTEKNIGFVGVSNIGTNQSSKPGQRGNGNMSTKDKVTTEVARTDFRDWYTITIDGSDAKDLDDAISIRREKNGGYTLAVHIADVAEYVTEGSAIDREALLRATSIYTPGKVIPMLPEILSNDLCSLHPGTTKLTLSCVMMIDRHGYVEHTDIVEGIIESQHRGVYDDIASRYTELQKSTTNSVKTTDLDTTIQTAFDLYYSLEKRRRKEGKIAFESTEIYFDFGDTDPANQIAKTPKGIKRRERNDAHKLIEECMVLANEEVAKWCHAAGLPFLSRVHGLPGNEQTEIIHAILSKKDTEIATPLGIKTETAPLEPTQIREFLEAIDNPTELYRYSRLLLPKMAKATYSDTPFRHFGLALEYYAHFTSPIRRYPDLQIHRIIKEKIQGTLTPDRITHYRTILKRVARTCSEHERSAEDIERAMNSLYICRYMSDQVGRQYSGQISGLSEFALFVELDNGIETTLYLPRGRYHIDMIEGILTSPSGKQIGQISQKIQVKIESINMTDRRVVVVQV